MPGSPPLPAENNVTLHADGTWEHDYPLPPAAERDVTRERVDSPFGTVRLALHPNGTYDLDCVP